MTIQTASETPNTYGEQVRTWSTFATVWASIEPLSGNELENARQRVAKASHLIRCRHVASVTPKMRLIYGSRTFDIGAAMDVDERNRELRLLCTEVL